ncbi:hypothetical protein BJV82DRAFT_632171 [Fennellomyces sp. T-0311]|nr:hypothetical protein BJV82DRAFT_632171 [Fennellomyces sp. T-0311]
MTRVADYLYIVGQHHDHRHATRLHRQHTRCGHHDPDCRLPLRRGEWGWQERQTQDIVESHKQKRK